jgi:hypothetical protein
VKTSKLFDIVTSGNLITNLPIEVDMKIDANWLFLIDYGVVEENRIEELLLAILKDRR